MLYLNRLCCYLIPTAFFLCYSIVSIQAQSTVDTLYPGTDLHILRIEPLKKEVIQGEGIAVQMSVINNGITTSASTYIDFWISDSDEGELNPEDINSSKELLPLRQDTKVDFSHLVVIPEEYSGKFVYITAAIRTSPKNDPDPTPDNNRGFTAVKIGNPASYKDGMYTYDGAILSLEMVKTPKKLVRGKTYTSRVVFSITGTKAPKAGQSIDIILSRDNTLEGNDALVVNYPVPRARNGEPTEVIKEITFGKHFRKGKAYIFAVIRPGKWNDPDMDNNVSKPVKIKLK